MSFPFSFDSGQFHLLNFTQLVTGFVTQQQSGENRSQTKACGNRKGAPGKTDVATLQQVVSTDGEYKHSSGGITGSHGVDKFYLSDRVKDDGGKVSHLHAHGFEVKLCTDRVLHPAIGDQDPECGEVRTKGDQPGTNQVLNPGHAIPAKEKHTDEGRLQEEGHQTLDRQRRTKYVANVVRIIGPVSTKLELHGQAGSHAKSEVDTEQFAPEPGHVLVHLFAGHDIDRLHNGEHKAQAECQGDKKKMIKGCQCELEP